MTVPTRAEATRRSAVLLPLLRAAHFGPTVAVTTIVALLAVALDLSAYRGLVVTAAVFTGQLTIGWGNDLLDADRDRAVGRKDKPLANRELSPAVVLRCLVVAAVACVVLSFLAGWRSGATHLGLGVALGHLYNLYFKATSWSWLPYAVAFGSLPAVVSLAGSPPEWPPAWMIGTAATLGVAAHFLNTLPDFDDDAATGVHGLPHRIGAGGSRLLATGLLVAATAVAVLGPAGAPATWAWGALAVVVALAALALFGRGRAPFYAAVAIALVDVALLAVVAG
ncbi:MULTISPECIES: UbiA family prenyltransferase [Nocardioides]|uniref:UbiA family prenyltransferase n=1 Tax=Nocardioides vastitatis TaxID=2568655 RepID=A0ABW0ZFR2_9ACTN|nr:UbiA family prenyltransferase [Nocardioides sp.]